MFDHFVGQPGKDCYSSSNIPISYCQKAEFVWAVGGKVSYFVCNYRTTSKVIRTITQAKLDSVTCSINNNIICQVLHRNI